MQEIYQSYITICSESNLNIIIKGNTKQSWFWKYMQPFHFHSNCSALTGSFSSEKCADVKTLPAVSLSPLTKPINRLSLHAWGNYDSSSSTLVLISFQEQVDSGWHFHSGNKHRNIKLNSSKFKLVLLWLCLLLIGVWEIPVIQQFAATIKDFICWLVWLVGWLVG